MVSVLRPQKDPLFAIRAVARLASSGRLPGRFAIVGNGPIEGEVRDEIDRLELHDHVRWFPYRGSVDPYLAALDLFVLPSAWEAMPLSLLEAMSCGLPILATGVGGTPEVVTDGVTGRIVPHGDELELAVGLLELLSDAELRARLGDAGRGEHEARFQVERMLDDTEALYRELLGAIGATAPALAKGNGRLRLT
jgi:glycosyltransferase involved in cell wall biosynthesis